MSTATTPNSPPGPPSGSRRQRPAGPSAVTGLLRVLPIGSVAPRRFVRLLERNVLVYRNAPLIIITGFFEPLLYLLSLGVGLGALIGSVSGVDYTTYVAPALLATSAMNGAVYDATNVFWKLRYDHVYDAVLATPLSPADVAVGEVCWALLRGALYSAMFLVVVVCLGLAQSWWLVLAFPAALCISYAFAGIGVAAMCFMRTWQDFGFVEAFLLPLFLFSATFYPLTTYPGWAQWVVRATPLYQGVALTRGLALGTPNWAMLGHVAYLLVVGTLGVSLATRRLGGLLLS